MPHNDHWRAYRKQFHSAFRPRELEVLRPLILGALDQFLHCLATTPDQFSAHIRSYTSNVLSTFVYGFQQSVDTADPILTLMNANIEEFNEKVWDNVCLVDLLPISKRVPPNWPGAAFMRLGLGQRRKMDEVVQGMYDRLRAAMTEGKATSCVVTRSLEHRVSTGELSSAEEELIKRNAAVSFIAGTDTVCDLPPPLVYQCLLLSTHPD